jgi:6-pyruvoyltetrahydropterin/6-carboxytetrahydropterin synthase
MIVAKEFKWEAAHRIPWHGGKCRHLHGHSYKMIVEFEGTTDEKGIVIDFKEMKKIIEPYIDLIDHSTIIAAKDTELKEVFDAKGWNYFLLPYDSTAENLCSYFSNLLIEKHLSLLTYNHIKSVAVKIAETGTAYAYSKRMVPEQ